MNDSKVVYVSMAVDLLHAGHIRIIKEARKLGDVTVGLLTDKAIGEYRKIPYFDYNHRRMIAENIKGVKRIIEQDTWDCVPNIRKIKPNYVVHGDDWKKGAQSEKREKVIEALKDWGGKLIEPSYSKEFSTKILSKQIKDIGTPPENRRRHLKRMLKADKLVKVLEAHNGISGLIVENVSVEGIQGQEEEFDGIWISSLTDSTAKGKPDIELIDFSSRTNTIEHILEVTTKPIIVDGDSGGLAEHFVYMVKTLERLGVSAVIIEDKVGPKRNSLFGTDVNQTQASIAEFVDKIKNGKAAQLTKDFMIIARIESLILGNGLDDAINRAKEYINAGADGIMIHSKSKKPNEIFEFCKRYRNFEEIVPLVTIPSTYNSVSENQLKSAGVNIVIYANHLLRSAYPAMVKTAKSILKNQRSHEASEFCMPIKEILNLIPGSS